MVPKLPIISTSLGELLPEHNLPEQFAGLNITGLTIDSREVKPGYLFIAVQGLQVHGKAFIDQAVANGAVAVLIDEETFDKNVSIPIIFIEGLENKLSQIAGSFFSHPSKAMAVVGITGTNGKTTCSHLLGQALSTFKKKVGVLGTLGFGLVDSSEEPLIDTGMTTPDAIQTQKILAEFCIQDCETIVMEVSSHALEQGRVSDVAIDTAVFTNLTHDHLDYHGSMDAYGQAKQKLFAMPTIKSAIVNQDDDFSKVIVPTLSESCRLLTYSVDSQKSNFKKSQNHFNLHSIQFAGSGMNAKLMTPDGEFEFASQLIGRFNLSNLLAVVAVLYEQGEPLKDIVAVLPYLKPVPGRMELIPNTLGVQVVIDFAHTPDALQNTLKTLSSDLQGSLWCIFGCGGDRDRQKRPEMARVAEKFADHVVVTSDNPRTESPIQIFADIEKGFVHPREVIVDRSTAIEYAITEAQAGDTILIAGKGHEDYQLIGDKKFPFSDQQQARLCLRQREQRESNNA